MTMHEKYLLVAQCSQQTSSIPELRSLLEQKGLTLNRTQVNSMRCKLRKNGVSIPRSRGQDTINWDVIKKSVNP